MFDRVDMLQEGIQEINGKEYIYFEFESRVNGDRKEEGFKDPVLKYTYIQYLIDPGQKTLVFTFNAPRRQKEEWQEVAREMMLKIKVK